jgi:hypothetical protein
VNPSSAVPSQSSSAPLQLSAGGVHVSHVHIELHVREPVEPQLVVQLPVEPAVHSTLSSTVPSQSSSMLLQASAGGTQLPRVHVESQVRVPVVPQPVVQLVVDPTAHEKPSSTVASQSSSTPLQLSAAAVHAPHPQLESQVCMPLDPQVVVQLLIAPTAQVNPSSGTPLQSSSMPLQVSAGGEHTPHEQLVLHTRLPVEPQLVMHVPVSPRTHVKASSAVPSQSSSRALQVSGAPGKTVARVSSQSVLGTPPTAVQDEAPYPSSSASSVVATHMPGVVPTQELSVQASPSSQVGGVPG